MGNDFSSVNLIKDLGTADDEKNEGNDNHAAYCSNQRTYKGIRRLYLSYKSDEKEFV